MPEDAQRAAGDGRQHSGGQAGDSVPVLELPVGESRLQIPVFVCVTAARCVQVVAPNDFGLLETPVLQHVEVLHEVGVVATNVLDAERLHEGHVPTPDLPGTHEVGGEDLHVRRELQSVRDAEAIQAGTSL